MQIAGVATMCLQRLAAMLLQVCQNPTQPGFNHYLFESVAALIKFSAAADVGKVAELEQHLFPAFNIVLQQDVQVGSPTVLNPNATPEDTPSIITSSQLTSPQIVDHSDDILHYLVWHTRSTPCNSHAASRLPGSGNFVLEEQHRTIYQSVAGAEWCSGATWCRAVQTEILQCMIPTCSAANRAVTCTPFGDLDCQSGWCWRPVLPYQNLQISGLQLMNVPQ